MAYVKRFPIKNGLNNSINYILNESKTDNNLLISSNNCATNQKLAYEMMMNTKEEYKKTDKVLGYHFIQSFKPREVDEVIAHELGKKWADKFLHNHEYLLSTHNDKNHIHNHIIINSVNFVDGKKYVTNIKELNQIRTLSDEVCKEYGLSIIIPKDQNRNKSYKEWKENTRSSSWKDKVKIDINESIEQSKSYEEFLKIMKEKEYELKDNSKHNTFKHKEMGRAVRGYTLGDLYTEENIKLRIKEIISEKSSYLNNYKDLSKLEFNEERFYDKSFSKREIVKKDIDDVIKISNSYEEFENNMSKYRGYKLNDERLKHITFNHDDMQKGIRGKTIGEEYTREAIKERIQKNLENKQKNSKNLNEIYNIRQKYFRRRSPNSKYKYIKSDRTLNIDVDNSNINKASIEKIVLESLVDKKEHYRNIYKEDKFSEEFKNKEEFLVLIKELNIDIDTFTNRTKVKESIKEVPSEETSKRISLKNLLEKFSLKNETENRIEAREKLQQLKDIKVNYQEIYMDYKEGKTEKVIGFDSIEDFTIEVKKLNKEIENYENQLNADIDYEK